MLIGLPEKVARSRKGRPKILKKRHYRKVKKILAQNPYTSTEKLKDDISEVVGEDITGRYWLEIWV